MKHPFSCLRSLAALAGMLGASGAALAHEPSGVTAAEAQQRLEKGNARFVAGHLSTMSPARIAASRRKVAQGQKPFAIIVGCSDSRVGRR